MHQGEGKSRELRLCISADDEIRPVESVLETGRTIYWTGTEGGDFEREFASITIVNHANPVANGTVALEIAVRALGLPPGSEVVTAPRTFVATVAAVVSVNLNTILAYVDPESGSITVDTVWAAQSTESVAGRAVHLGGWPAEVAGLHALRDAATLALIEHCCRADGARVGGRHVGTFGDLATWSFCQDRIITTGGEVDMTATNNEAIGRRVWALKGHSKSSGAVCERGHPPGIFRPHMSPGMSGRKTEMRVVLGRIQWQERYRRHRYGRNKPKARAAHTSGIESIALPIQRSRCEHASYGLYAYLDELIAPDSRSRDRLVHEVTSAAGMPLYRESCAAIYLERASDAQGDLDQVDLPVTHQLGEQSISFHVHPELPQKGPDPQSAVSTP